MDKKEVSVKYVSIKSLIRNSLSGFFVFYLSAYSVLGLSADKYNRYCHYPKDLITKYACLAEHQVKDIRFIHFSPSERIIIRAIEVMNLLQTMLGAGRYANDVFLHGQFNISMSNQTFFLKNHLGICGNHQYLFNAILNKMGIQTRAVDFYYSVLGRMQNHPATEVWNGKKWLYFDVSWGSYWLENDNSNFLLLSLKEIMDGYGKRMTNLNAWYLAMSEYNKKNGKSDVFDYLKAKNTQILKNKGGLLSISFVNANLSLAGLPNYIGRAVNTDSLAWKLVGQFPRTWAVLIIENIGGDCSYSRIKIGAKSFPVMKGVYPFQLTKDTIIKIEGKDAVCYAIVKEIKKRK
jgi:hypothetical protein